MHAAQPADFLAAGHGLGRQAFSDLLSNVACCTDPHGRSTGGAHSGSCPAPGLPSTHMAAPTPLSAATSASQASLCMSRGSMTAAKAVPLHATAVHHRLRQRRSAASRPLVIAAPCPRSLAHPRHKAAAPPVDRPEFIGCPLIMAGRINLARAEEIQIPLIPAAGSSHQKNDKLPMIRLRQKNQFLVARRTRLEPLEIAGPRPRSDVGNGRHGHIFPIF